MADLILNIGTIPDAKVATARDAFLREKPKPTSGPDSLLTDKQWIEKVIREVTIAIINSGRKKLAADAETPDPSIITA